MALATEASLKKENHSIAIALTQARKPAAPCQVNFLPPRRASLLRAEANDPDTLQSSPVA